MQQAPAVAELASASHAEAPTGRTGACVVAANGGNQQQFTPCHKQQHAHTPSHSLFEKKVREGEEEPKKARKRATESYVQRNWSGMHNQRVNREANAMTKKASKAARSGLGPATVTSRVR